jgi:hypothetical protein
MKRKYLFFALILLSISSCTTVQFETSQPKGMAGLSEFPTELKGIYSSKKNQDTLIISYNSFKYLSTTIFGQVKPTTLDQNEVVLKKLNDYYIMSLKDSNAWEVIGIKLKSNKLQIYYIYPEKKEETELLNKLKEITKVVEIKDNEGKTSKYLINPTTDEFQILLDKKLFSKILEFKKVK